VCDSLSEVIRIHGDSRGGYTVCWKVIGVASVLGQESYHQLAKHSTFGSTTPWGAEAMAVDWSGHQVCPRNVPGSQLERSHGSKEVAVFWISKSVEANAFDGQLAIEEVVLLLFLRVEVRIRLLGVTAKTISSGEIGTKHWTGEERAVAVVAPVERSGGSLK
jgi:hypothetical protein